MGKILIVDDVPTDIEAMRSVCTNAGHTCITASDGDQAFDIAKREKPNLVLLDVVLPKQDGFQVCRKLKKESETAEIPVILVSSKSQESDQFWGMKQGASQYLVKPIVPEALAEAIQKHLK
jgi:twitching motility two-component system response regulator PilH